MTQCSIARARLAVRVAVVGEAVAQLGLRASRAGSDHDNAVIGWALIGCAAVLALAGLPLVRVAAALVGEPVRPYPK
jgi:hypothetical protein